MEKHKASWLELDSETCSGICRTHLPAFPETMMWSHVTGSHQSSNMLRQRRAGVSGDKKQASQPADQQLVGLQCLASSPIVSWSGTSLSLT